MKPVTATQMRSLDQRASDEYGVPSLLLMENAGRGVVDVIRKKFTNISIAVVLCGKGNNGGDGFVIARHLYNLGWDIHIALFADPSQLNHDPRVNFEIVQKMNIPVTRFVEFDPDQLGVLINSSQLIVDALLGTGIQSELREPYRSCVDYVNATDKPVVAVDLPSGLHTDTGVILGAAIRADLTATLGVPKKGLFEGSGPALSGNVEIIDISLPRNLLETLE